MEVTIKFARAESETYQIEVPEVSRRPNQRWIKQKRDESETWILNEATRALGLELAEAIAHQQRSLSVLESARAVFEKIAPNKYAKPCADTGVLVDRETGFACLKDGKWIVLSWTALCRRFLVTQDA